ncbi:MAG: 16S rRNA (adenine(1518)-N(6)/adenine(1519)-N(6))-dimethyltransferase RsmA [Candidatus Paceibacteria bacterium]
MAKRPTDNYSSKSDSIETEKIFAKKSLGQNFLTSPTVPKWMCDAGDVKSGDIVLEIGPGTGVLTKELLNRGAVVTAIETDSRMITVLEETFVDEIANKNLTLIHGDMRTFPLSSILPATPYKIVANIPYYLSGYLLRISLETTPPPATLVFLMQKEVVERIARSKKSSLASLSVAVFGKPKYVKTVGRGHFSPSPKVDSAILAINNISHDALPSKEKQTGFFELLHAGFQSKRKQLAGNLQTLVLKEDVVTFLREQSLPITCRAEDLSIDTWLALYHFVSKRS